MNETEQRKYFASLTETQKINLLVILMDNEAKLRKEIDEKNGIFR